MLSIWSGHLILFALDVPCSAASLLPVSAFSSALLSSLCPSSSPSDHSSPNPPPTTPPISAEFVKFSAAALYPFPPSLASAQVAPFVPSLSFAQGHPQRRSPPCGARQRAQGSQDDLDFWQFMVAAFVADVVEHTMMFLVDTLKTRILRYKAFEPILLLGCHRFVGVDMRIRIHDNRKTYQIYATASFPVVFFDEREVDIRPPGPQLQEVSGHHQPEDRDRSSPDLLPRPSQGPCLARGPPPSPNRRVLRFRCHCSRARHLHPHYLPSPWPPPLQSPEPSPFDVVTFPPPPPIALHLFSLYFLPLLPLSTLL